MADSGDSSQEKTEEPTARKLEKAREDGQVPRSRELTTTAVILTGSFGLMIFGGEIALTLADVIRYNFSLDRATIFDTSAMIAHLALSFREALLSLLPIFSVLILAAIAGPVALGGWLFSGKSLMPKGSRMDPIAGLKRMISMKSLVELFKAIGKIAIIVSVSYILLSSTQGELLGLSEESLEAGIMHSLELSVMAAVWLSASTIFIALIDIPFQIHEYSKKLKMSRQDIKDEMKDTEGKPEVKSKIRQMQQQLSQQRMMQSVPDADVVITNPTHFSVALKYDPENMETPILLAKGVDHMAMRIREVARAHDIEFVQSPALARAIYHTTEIDHSIPQGLFLAVAQVLAYVFQLREYRKGHNEKPNYPRKPDLPKDMEY